MRTGFPGHAKHLFLLACAFLIALAGFLALRAAVVPAGFGLHGHYRAGAIGDVRARAIAYAGHAACADCHEAVVSAKNAGGHRGVACEGCHGALAAHAAEPASKPPLPGAAALCIRCHESDPAKPAGFPQVASKEHSGGADCGACHRAHAPGLKEEKR